MGARLALAAYSVAYYPAATLWPAWVSALHELPAPVREAYGFRWTARINGPWEGFAQADVGGGGSELSWQAIGAIGYRWNWGAVFVGYRYLHVDYEDGPYRLDAALAGPLIGANFRF